MLASRIALACIALAATSAAYAQTPDLERILVPTYVAGEIAGAYGSRWVTEVSITNTASRPVLILGYNPYPGGCGVPCPPVLATPESITFSPVLSFGRRGGAIVRVERQEARNVRFNLRVRDLSRQSETWGTEIPVVREAAFTSGPLQLLDVPLTADFRSMLRIFDAASLNGAAATVRFYRTNPLITSPVTLIIDPIAGPPIPDPLLAERTVTLTVEHNDSSPDYDFGYAEISNLGLTPEIAAADRVRIEIQPLTPGLRLWAFVSTTNNATQHVTTITPQ